MEIIKKGKKMVLAGVVAVIISAAVLTNGVGIFSGGNSLQVMAHIDPPGN